VDRQLLTRLSKWLQFVFTLVVLYVVGKFIYSQWQEIRRIDFTLVPLLFLFAIAVLLLFYLLYVFSWVRLIGWFNEDPPGFSPIRLAKIFFVSLITRYLPAGKIVNVGSRIELFKREGGRRLIAAKSILVEQFYLIGCALVFAWITILLVPDILLPQEISPYRILILIGGGAFLVVLVSADLLYSKIAEKINFEKMREMDISITWRQRLELLIRYLAINFFQGSAAFLFLTSVYHDSVMSPELFLYTAAAYPVSRFIGQMVVFIPGGIGVREGLFALALSPYFPVPAVLLAGAAMRLSSVLLEILIIMVTFLFDRSERVGESLSG
jgi:uncharacterized membrane protein YbhN (UPF0104 family)